MPKEIAGIYIPSQSGQGAQEKRAALGTLHSVIAGFAKKGFIATQEGLLSASLHSPDVFEDAFIYGPLADLVIDQNYLGPLRNVINFMLFEETNPQQLNPYDPQEPYLAEDFEDLFPGQEEREIAQALWEYEQGEMIKAAFEWATNSTVKIGIMGQVAAGKTTFLNTIQQTLNLQAINTDVRSIEPEDTEDYYPGVITMHDWRYQRLTTRGNQATLGDENLDLFAYATNSQQFAKAQLLGQGGHIRAERSIHKKNDATAFFIDYKLAQQLIDLPLDLPTNSILNNGENIMESVLSLLTNVEELKKIPGKVIGVISKLPVGQNISADVLNMVEAAYHRCIAYYQQHSVEFEEEIGQLLLIGVDFAIPDISGLDSKDTESTTISDEPRDIESSVKFTPRAYRTAQLYAGDFDRKDEDKKSVYKPNKNGPLARITRWLPIRDDSTFSGSMEVLQELLRSTSIPDLDVIDFNDSSVSGRAHYKDFLPHLK